MNNSNKHAIQDRNSIAKKVRTSPYFSPIISFALLLLGLLIQHVFKAPQFTGWISFSWYLLAYLPVALPVLKAAWRNLRKGEFFTEFLLMSIATIGAFAIKEYPEGVAVMLFYAVGELFQGAAVKNAKNNIKALLDIRPNIAHLIENDQVITIHPEKVNIGQLIRVKVGEKVPLDGKLLSEEASVNTSAITGESKPAIILKGEQLLAGSINLNEVIEIEVTKAFEDSSIARILHMVQRATNRKAKTELLIRRLAKVYTPIVFFLAVGICFIPYFFVNDYEFSTWLYRALIFLVISCPCALVISIPLGYFGGLGAASRHGILFKGANYLELLTKVKSIVMDKTGTVTLGVFKVKEYSLYHGFEKENFFTIVKSIEHQSTHPIAKAILQYEPEIPLITAENVKEVAGKGLTGMVNGEKIWLGNRSLMKMASISMPSDLPEIVETVVHVAIGSTYAGYIIVADEIKSNVRQSILELKKMGIKHISILSGDKDSITQKTASQIGVNQAKGGLLPEDKFKVVEEMKSNTNELIAFVGDGINDAPVLALADVGIAMGAMGSDVAIETADVIIQTDEISKIATGIKIGKATNNIIWQNISLAFGVKAIVMILGAIGLATMWAAVFADVGVALLAIVNAVRLQHMKW